MKRLCTILARGGSKGVINKNLRELGGKPLIAHTITQAQASNLFGVIAVSSDSEAILCEAKQRGVTYLIKRPDEMAADASPKLPAVQHCVQEVEKRTKVSYDTICDLDPTAPFRTLEDIAHCVKLLEESGISNVLTGASARKSPYFNLVELDDKGTVKLSKPPAFPIVRRQDSPQCYDLNASIYVWKRGILFSKEPVFNKDTRLYVMPRERSVEIDTEFDFLVASLLISKEVICG